MSKQSRTPRQNAVGRWCAHRGWPAGAWLGNYALRVAVAVWEVAEDRGFSLATSVGNPGQGLGPSD